MFIIMLLSGIAFIGSIAWFIATPGFEPGVAIAGSLATLITTWRESRKRKQKANQNQLIGKNGFGIQAGGSVTTGDISNHRKENDAE